MDSSPRPVRSAQMIGRASLRSFAMARSHLIIIVYLLCTYCFDWSVIGTVQSSHVDVQSREQLMKSLVISMAMDAGSLEIQREAFRLINSIAVFGGELMRSATISVCLSKDFEGDDHIESALAEVDRLRSFHNLSIVVHHSKRFSKPSYSPSLNKLCAFDVPSVPATQSLEYFLLYLDADIFVAADPIPQLMNEMKTVMRNLRGVKTTKITRSLFQEGMSDDNAVYIARKTVYCGRPWRSTRGIETFPDFVNMTDRSLERFEFEDLLRPYDGGFSYYGTCNTGMFFLRLDVARDMVSTARDYLHQLEQDSFRAIWKPPFTTDSFSIDSVLLWAAIHWLQLDVHIVSPSLNYMVALNDSYMDPYLSAVSIPEINSSEQMIDRIPTILDDGYRIEPYHDFEVLHLLHFSTPSDLQFRETSIKSGEVVHTSNQKNCHISINQYRDSPDTRTAKVIRALFDSKSIKHYRRYEAGTEENSAAVSAYFCRMFLPPPYLR